MSPRQLTSWRLSSHQTSKFQGLQTIWKKQNLEIQNYENLEEADLETSLTLVEEGNALLHENNTLNQKCRI